MKISFDISYIIVDDTWKDKSKQFPTNWTKYFKYMEKKFDDGQTRCERVVRDEFKDTPTAVLGELATTPCMEHDFKKSFYSGYEMQPNCSKCGAIESVFLYHKNNGKFFAGNGHLV